MNERQQKTLADIAKAAADQASGAKLVPPWYGRLETLVALLAAYHADYTDFDKKYD